MRLCRSKNPLPFPFSQRSHVGNLRQTIQGKGRSSKRKENRRLSFLFAPRRGRGESPRSAERNSPLRLSEKLPARQGRTRLRSSCPRSPGAERRCRPDRVNRLRGSSTPVIRCRIISPEKAPVFKMHLPCGALCRPLIVCDEHQRMPRPVQAVKQL